MPERLPEDDCDADEEELGVADSLPDSDWVTDMDGVLVTVVLWDWEREVVSVRDCVWLVVRVPVIDLLCVVEGVSD